MNLDEILAELKRERERIDKALAALGGLSRSRTMPSAGGRRGGRRRISAAGRKRLSDIMKKRWAERRGKARRGKAKRIPRHLSAAARAKIAAAQRARWAILKRERKSTA